MSKQKKTQRTKAKNDVEIIPKPNNNNVDYDARLIRDSLKSNIYRAVSFLNLDIIQAFEKMQSVKELKETYDKASPDQRRTLYSDVTMLEMIFMDAVSSKNWGVIENMIEKITTTNKSLVIDDDQKIKIRATLEQKQRMIQSAQNAIKRTKS